MKLILLFCAFVGTIALDCKDHNNKAVDWFIVYKLPQVGHYESLIDAGEAYIYMTSTQQHWVYSNKSIISSNSILDNTLSDLYNNQNETSFIAYNNEPPNGVPSYTDAYSKGIAAFDTDGGYWMMHSTSNFPDLEANLSFPPSEIRYGQTFFCFSMNLPYLNELGNQLQHINPNVYKAQILEEVKSRVPSLFRVSINYEKQNTPWVHGTYLTSKRNNKFLVFTKAPGVVKDLYSGIISPYVDSSLFVQTGAKGDERLSSVCSKRFDVKNIGSLMVNILGLSFKSQVDDSIWAVSPLKSKKRWTCFGDLNRSKFQINRGAAAICLKNRHVHEQFLKMLATVERC